MRRGMGKAALAPLLAGLLAAAPAHGALRAVSGAPDPAADEVLAGGAPEGVAYSLATGFPLWYGDEGGLRLALCLDAHVALEGGGVAAPCLTEQPFPSLPISFPSNFGAEAVYWSASAFGAFTSARTVEGVTQLLSGDALVVLALEAGFQDLIPVDGDQVTFARIRLRANVPVPGTYRVTHPYGEAIFVVPAAGVDREIDQTQDVGNVLPLAAGAPVPPAGPPPLGDHTLALLDGPVPPPPGAFDPAVNAGVVSIDATGLGPFLVAAETPGGAPAAPLVAADGRVYLSDPGTELLPRAVPVTGSPFGTNHVAIELLDPPPGFVLDAASGTQVVVVDRFQLVGKVFDEGPNAAPVAVPDEVATARGAPVAIDVLANDVDVVDPIANRHGIDPQAIGILPAGGDPAAGLRLTRPLTTPAGGTVRRVTSLATGLAELVYTPAPGFAGVDVFAYVVQDAGGLVSAPATVTVLVDDLAVAAAEYRPRTGRWRVRGTTGLPGAGEVALFASPRALLAPVAGAGAGAARGSATFHVRAGEMAFRLAVDPLPGVVTAVHLHLGAGGADGPAVFLLHDTPSDGPFTGRRAGTLTAARLLFVPERPTLTLEDVAQAVLAGDAYVDVHTVAAPGGALRGAVAAQRIGTAAVDPATGAWSFVGRSSASPGGAPATVSAVSALGVRAAAVPLRLR